MAHSASFAIGSPVGLLARNTKAWTTIMMALATLALGLAFFGLFFSIVAACDHL
jgi:hypothetical protein